MRSRTSLHFIRHIRQLLNHLLDPVLGYSRIVTGTKTLVFSIALILALVLISLPLFDFKKKDFIATDYNSILKRITTPTMMNPRFHGLDNKQQPYHIFADTAIKTDDNRIVLTNVNAEIKLNMSGWVSAKATQAIYSLEKKEINLFGIVSIYSDSGYELETSTAHIDLNNHTASGQNDIRIQGTPGTINAGSFLIREDNTLFFNHRVKMTIYPESTKSTFSNHNKIK